MFYGLKNGSLVDEFFAACQDGRADRVSELIRDGIDPNCEDFFTLQRPIHVAVRNGSLDVAKILLADERVKLDVVDGAWKLPLDLAALNQDADMVAMLESHLCLGKAQRSRQRLG